jgi:hypothetical protein
MLPWEKSKFQKFYLRTVVILSVITAIIAIPSVLIIIVFATAGMGLILLIIPPAMVGFFYLHNYSTKWLTNRFYRHTFNNVVE